MEILDGSSDRHRRGVHYFLMTPEQFNKWRVIPRILMFSYYGFFAYAFIWIAGWFMAYDFNSIENDTVALAIVGFPVAILTVLSGVLTMLTNKYFSTGGEPK